MASISLQRLIDKMKLKNLTEEIDINKIKITQPDINRPAIQLTGYLEHYDSTRLQIVGFVEYTYMQSLSPEQKAEIYDRILNHATPAFVFCRELEMERIRSVRASQETAVSSWAADDMTTLSSRIITTAVRIPVMAMARARLCVLL